jgi:CRISPR/Cas system-associated exonuclease Cas4 (RecB family)
MTLPTDFQFSQGSLQDYMDCPRRFQLRYLLRLAWPAVEAEPALENERRLQQGAAFHRLVHQHVLGLPAERLSRAVTDEDLSRWWHNYLVSAPAALQGARYPEIVLSAPLSGYRLVARYDLIVVDPGERAIILDWKTSHRRPPRQWLTERLQTRVYMYLLVRAGSHLNAGRPCPPERVEMVYWFPEFPDAPERFPYDAARFKADSDYLTALTDEVMGRSDEDLPLTDQERRCRYCRYRSLCERGVEAGALDEAEAEPETEGLGPLSEIDLDIEQIAEIEF